MNFVVPDECEIVDALAACNCGIFNLRDIMELMKGQVAYKNPSDRLISWLVLLGLIPSTRNKWGTYIFNMCERYKQHLNHYLFRHPSEPTRILNEETETLLKLDVPRSINFIQDFLKDLKIPDNFIDNLELRIMRIFTILLTEEKSIHYSQGYDRSLAVALSLVSQIACVGSLTADFVEAVTYYLTLRIIMYNPMFEYAYNNKAIVQHFDKIDRGLKFYCPELHSQLKNENSTCLPIGYSWEFLLYADDHTITDIFLLWDQIFSRNDCAAGFVQALTIAHFMQIPIVHSDAVLSRIKSFKSWDTHLIIADAVKILNKSRTCVDSCCDIVCPTRQFFMSYHVDNRF